jgi:hypothetical protein
MKSCDLKLALQTSNRLKRFLLLFWKKLLTSTTLRFSTVVFSISLIVEPIHAYPTVVARNWGCGRVGGEQCESGAAAWIAAWAGAFDADCAECTGWIDLPEQRSG